LATPCDTFALKLAKQERINKNNKMFKYIVKMKVLHLMMKNITKESTPMTILKFIT
jgi:hypothetical protein